MKVYLAHGPGGWEVQPSIRQKLSCCVIQWRKQKQEWGLPLEVGMNKEGLRLEPASLSLGNSHAHHSINSVHDNEAQ